jgi:hypothetical protein
MWNSVQAYQPQSFWNEQVKLVVVLPTCDICYITDHCYVYVNVHLSLITYKYTT